MTYEIFTAIMFMACAIFIWPDNNIPNWLIIALFAGFGIFFFLSGQPLDQLDQRIYAAIGLFVIGFILFAKSIIGGGTSKLLPVIGLWLPPDLLGRFIIIGIAIYIIALILDKFEQRYFSSKFSSILLLCGAVVVTYPGL